MSLRLRNDIGAKSLKELEPCQDYLVLKLEDQQETEGGLVIPKMGMDGDESDTKSMFRLIGRVLKAGPGRTTDTGEFVKQEFQVGDVVYFRDSSYVNLQPAMIQLSDGTEVLLIRAQLVYAYVRRPKDGPKYLPNQTDFISSGATDKT